jgi:hypothetical protein
MSFATEKQVIESYVVGNYSSTLIKYENDEMNDSSVNEWIRVSVQNASANQVSLGSDPLYRYRGIAYFQIFVRPDIGSGRALEIADILSPLFKSKRISGILFRVPRVQKVGSYKDWYQVNVSVEFSREE